MSFKHNTNINALKEDYHFLIKAATKKGFLDLYFSVLKDYKSPIKAFNYLNERYYSLVGEYRYSNYNSFRKNLYLKNNKHRS